MTPTLARNQTVADFGDDDFLGDCMRLFSEWTSFEEIEEEEEATVVPVAQDGLSSLMARLIATMIADELAREAAKEKDPLPYVKSVATVSASTVSLPSGWDAVSARLSTSSVFNLFSDRVASPVPSLFSIDPSGEADEEEVVVEPETHVSLPMPALPSTTELLPTPSGDIRGALSCPDVLMGSLAVLLYETRHLHFINERLALPPPPQWMVDMAAEREMDPPNSLVSTVSTSTVSLPSGWDAVSARLSTSSVFNLFSDPVASPVPSLFSIDPTGALSTVSASSTVSVPASFWDTASTVSVTGAEPTVPLNKTSSTSSLLIESCSSLPSSSSSSLDLSSDDSGCPSSLPTKSISSFSLSICRCPPIEDDEDDVPTTSSVSTTTTHSVSAPCCFRCSGEDQSISDDEELFSGDSSTSGYETDVDSEPKKMTTVSAATQTEGVNQSALALKLAECDALLEKLAKVKKELRELL